MKLLVDLGNSRLKWAQWDGVRLQAGGAAAHNGGAAVDFSALWNSVDRPDAVYVASVAGAAIESVLAEELRTRFGRAPVFVRSARAACGVRNAYAHPEQLGVDRFLGLIAAHAQAQAPIVIASCGTALTLDALAADGAHLGGLIAASPDLAQAALRGNTARLGATPQGRIAERADNTADAIESGTWLAAVALVERFVACVERDLRAKPELLLTGGGAARLAERLALPHRIDGELVLRGLACIADAGGLG